MDYELMGMRLRKQRSLAKLTQEALAMKTGVSTSYIGHLERGEKKASLDTLVALCNALGISPTILLQDSLSPKAMENQSEMDENDRQLMQGLMAVLREHGRRD